MIEVRCECVVGEITGDTYTSRAAQNGDEAWGLKYLDTVF